MSAIKIDADALFRAVTSHDFKLLGYYLDLRNGEISSKTLPPEAVKDAPMGPRVQPLPVMGGDLSVKKDAQPFGPPPSELGKKPDLFKDDGPKQKKFEGEFWKRESGKQADPFGGGGFKRESSAKKLAELFGDKKADAAPVPAPKTESKVEGAYVADIDPNSPMQRIPPASAEQNKDWVRAFITDCGDPEIKPKLQPALSSDQPVEAIERALRNFQRLGQQWQRYYRKQALHYAAAWLKALPVQWEIVEADERAPS